tara:strand:- start:73137 stop:73643 length:507 start_codon:yes stop_codon:yes gene_type:complete
MKKLSVILCESIVALSLLLPVTAMAASEGETAPLFTLPDIDADKPAISLESLRGKTVYVDFWASWCAPCLRSMPLINELYGKYRDQDFEVIAINVDDPIEDGQDFLLDNPLDYLIAADTDNTVLNEFGVTGMPTSFLIDKDGVIRMVHMGFRGNDIETIEAAVLELLE